MIGALFLLLLGLPILELYVIVQVAQGIGLLPTIALLIAVSIAGAWLLKQQGMATWRRVHVALAEGRVPADEVVDGALILLGGALFVTPGFVTDSVGLLLLVPQGRAGVKRSARRLLGWAAAKRVGGAVTVVRTGRRAYEARKVRAERPRRASGARVLPPFGEEQGPEDDSRDRG